MSLWQALLDIFARPFRRKQRDETWNARFTNPPAPRDGKLPLDPGKSELS